MLSNCCVPGTVLCLYDVCKYIILPELWEMRDLAQLHPRPSREESVCSVWLVVGNRPARHKFSYFLFLSLYIPQVCIIFLWHPPDQPIKRTALVPSQVLLFPPSHFTFSLTLRHPTYHTCGLFIVTKVAFHCSMTLGTLVCFIHCYQPVPTIVFGT